MQKNGFAVMESGKIEDFRRQNAAAPDFRDNAMYFGEMLQYMHFAARFGSFASRKVTPTGQRMHSAAPTD